MGLFTKDKTPEPEAEPLIRGCHVCGVYDAEGRHASSAVIIVDGVEQPHYHHHECGARTGCALCMQTWETMNG